MLLVCIEWHLQKSVFDVINDGWDMMIAFPPCTHLANSGARWFKEKQEDGRQLEAINFFQELLYSNIPKIAIENPIGIMSRLYRKPDQIVQPYALQPIRLLLLFQFVLSFAPAWL